MRIGFNTQILNMNVTGSGTYARYLLRALEEMPSLQVVSLQLDYKRLGSGSRVAKLVNAMLDLGYLQFGNANIAQREGLELIHYPAFLVTLGGNHRKVVTIHDMSFFSSPDAYHPLFRLYYKLLVPLSARNADCVITGSETSLKNICHYCKISPQKVRVTPYGVTPNWFDAHDMDVSKDLPPGMRGLRFVLAVGEPTPRKNLVRLIEAFSCFAKKMSPHAPHLVLAGPALRQLQKEYVGQLQRLVKAKGLDSVVHFLDYVPFPTLFALMRCADALVYASLDEGFGLPILESMACGTPVLCSNISSMPEVAGDAALLVNPRDVDEIAEGLHCIVTDHGLREVLIEKGIVRAKQFSWEKTARSTVAVYEQILEYDIVSQHSVRG